MQGYTKAELAFAGELAQYKNQWVAIDGTGSSEKIVGYGQRIQIAKTMAEENGFDTPTFRKVPSGKLRI